MAVEPAFGAAPIYPPSAWSLSRRYAGRAAPTVVVSSEVGLSIVPENALARAFRDAAGELHQAVARISGRVVLTVAGYPLTVKDATRR